jgi:hypothetical protein
MNEGRFGFNHRHLFRPVIRHRPRHPIAVRPSSSGTTGHTRIVVEIVERRFGQRTPSRDL